MEVVICDTKGCGAIVKGKQVRGFVKENSGEGWDIEITLTEEVDRCPECSRKLFARAAYAAWNDLKKKKAKEPTDVN